MRASFFARAHALGVARLQLVLGTGKVLCSVTCTLTERVATMQQNQPALELRLDRLQELCESAGIKSLRDLAGRIGVSPSTLWRIEHGFAKPSPQVIARIKLAFPMASFDDLIEVAA